MTDSTLASTRTRRERFEAIKGALRISWEASPGGLVKSLVITGVSSLTPGITVWLTRGLANSLAATNGGQPWASYLAALVGVIAIQRVTGGIRESLEVVLAEEVSRHTDRQFLTSAGLSDLAYLEDPDWLDRRHRAANALRSRPVNLVRASLQFVGSALTMATMFGVLFAVDPVLLPFAAGSVLVTIPAQRYRAREQYRLFFGVSSKERERFYIRGLLTETGPAKEVRALNLHEHLLEKHGELVDQWIWRVRKSLRRTNAAIAITGLISAGLLGLAYLWIAAHSARGGEFQPGDFVALAGALAAVATLVGDISRAFVGIGENASFLADYFSFLELQPTITAPEDPVRVSRPLAKSIELQSVWFRYRDDLPYVLQDISLKLEPGKLLAIVGENGSGKSTLVKLLLRFYDPSEGRIRWDGTDIRNVDPADLRRSVGVLFQDFVTFAFTARENVSFGDVNRGADDAEVMHAIRGADGAGIIEKLPKGLDSHILPLFDDGRDLSGGERQRLALARLLYRNADLWVLDEPTAALDPLAEAAVFRKIRDLIGNRAGIVVSHRFGTVRSADQIAVMREGRLVELGSHAELLAAGELYADMFYTQASAFEK